MPRDIRTPEQIDADALESKRAGMVVSMRQTRLALLDVDLLSQIEATIEGLGEPDRTKAQIEWEYAAVVERWSPWVNNLTGALGMSAAQVDDLFALAATK